MTSDLHLFTQLGDDTYMTEDCFPIEIIALNGFLMWASSSSGYYDQSCDTVYLGVIEKARRNEWGMTNLEVRQLSESAVSPVADGNLVEQLCARQTVSFLSQCPRLDLLDSPKAVREPVRCDLKKEGF